MENELRPSIQRMERIGAFEPVISVGGILNERIRIPGHIIDQWFLCLCWVRGRVIKSDSGMPICGARIHVCEVDKLFWWIQNYPKLTSIV